MISKIEVSTKAILMGLAVIAGAWVVLQIRDILLLLFIAFLLMTAIHPLVVALQRIRIPRVFGILIVYAVIFGVFGISFAGALPALVIQVTKLIKEVPSFIASVLPYWNIASGTIVHQIDPFGE
ncbi:MAG: AI-2E family transporter, partial [Patescibacteria group bacterium]